MGEAAVALLLAAIDQSEQQPEMRHVIRSRFIQRESMTAPAQGAGRPISPAQLGEL